MLTTEPAAQVIMELGNGHHTIQNPGRQRICDIISAANDFRAEVERQERVALTRPKKMEREEKLAFMRSQMETQWMMDFDAYVANPELAGDGEPHIYGLGILHRTILRGQLDDARGNTLYGLENFGDERRKVKHLVIYNGDPDHPIEASTGKLLREVLNCFRNLQDLTVVTKYHCNNNTVNLDYLEKGEILETPGYAAEGIFHPLVFKEFPLLESDWHLWADSNWILKRASYYELPFQVKKESGL
jgi:hypothetical protein